MSKNTALSYAYNNYRVGELEMTEIKKASSKQLKDNLKHAKAGGWTRTAKEIEAELSHREDVLIALAMKKFD